VKNIIKIAVFMMVFKCAAFSMEQPKYFIHTLDTDQGIWVDKSVAEKNSEMIAMLSRHGGSDEIALPFPVELIQEAFDILSDKTNVNDLSLDQLISVMPVFEMLLIPSSQKEAALALLQKKASLPIIKAALQRDGDTIIKILDGVPLERRQFYLEFPEFNFCFHVYKGRYDSWCKIYKNYFNFVDVAKKMGMTNNVERMAFNKIGALQHQVVINIGDPGKQEGLYYRLRVKNSQGKEFFYAIDNPAIEAKENEGNATKVMPTLLMLAAYESNVDDIKKELLKPHHSRDELVHSLFIAIDHDCTPCVQALLSKKETLKVYDNKDNYGLYRALLEQTAKRRNMDIFELLIKEDPVGCLNTPGKYPLKNESDLTTVLDTCIRGANPSFYSSFTKPANEESKFFEKSIEVCKKYGAKTLDQLVKEGYKLEPKPQTFGIFGNQDPISGFTYD